jgi:predicted transcriptional regulator of viral defense system
MARGVPSRGHELASRYALLRTRDFERFGVPRYSLGAMVEQGHWERCGHGLYRSLRRDPHPHHSLVEVASRAPRGVVCLLSALRFHELTTERSSEVWLALPRNCWRPEMETVPLRILRFSGLAYEEGIEVHRIEGVDVRVYSVAKTIADCFKFRNQLGISVAIEALRDGWRTRKVDSEELWRCAKACRVSNVIRPYLEAVTV